MSERRHPATFVCEGCHETITRLPSPARDNRRQYCSLACKLRAWGGREQQKRTLICCWCSASFTGYDVAYCSSQCRALSIYAHGAARRKTVQTVTLSCVQCGLSFVRRKGIRQSTCSLACKWALHSVRLRGKKYRPLKVVERICGRCHRTFIAKQKQVVLCRFCVRALDPHRDHGKPERRAKIAGVPYVYGIKPEQVFQRDNWHCALCGCATPKRLRGTYKPNAPELDHIIPINAKGGSPGHVWENVQCACRKCNMSKRDKPLGQLRLAV